MEQFQVWKAQEHPRFLQGFRRRAVRCCSLDHPAEPGEGLEWIWMRSAHGAVGTCPSLALHIADVPGNSLERTFLATSPPALPVPNCCMLQLSSPSLPTPQLLPCASGCRNCSCPLLGCRSSLVLGRGTLGAQSEELCCVPSTQTGAGHSQCRAG